MKEKLYTGYKLEEVERLAVKELGVPKEDMYFDEISETEINVIVDANPVKKGKDFLESFLKNANILEPSCRCREFLRNVTQRIRKL